MSTLAVGVIGHVDHGKTALVRALTGTDTDRLAEEKARGISIVLGFAHLELPRGSLDLIDMPGHERFVRTMVSGATGIGALLLVIDAVEGARAQTLEHLEIARALGIRRGVVALAKCDLLPPARRGPAVAAARTLAIDAGLVDAAVIETSARSGEGIFALRAALVALAAAARAPVDQGFFWFPIDRVFAIAGFGTVLTGTLRRGRLDAGAAVEILPASDTGEPRRTARVRGLQVHGKAVDGAGPGQRLAVNLRGIEATDLSPGDALATPGLLGASAWQDVALTLGRDAPELGNGARVQLLFGTAELPARLRLVDRETVGAGEQALAQLRLERAVVVPAREPFIIRQPSPARTLGGGRLLGAAPGRRRRYDRLAVLETLAAASVKAAPAPEAVEVLLADAGETGTTLLAMARTLGVTGEAVKLAVEKAGAVLLGRDRFMAAPAFDALEGRLLGAMAAFQGAEPLAAGLGQAALRTSAAPATAEEMLDVVLARMVAKRRLSRVGALFRLPAEHAGGVAPAEQRALIEVEARFRNGALTPPDIAVAAGVDVIRAKAIRHLVRAGTLVRTTDLVQKREVIFHAGAVQEAVRRLADAFPAGTPFLVKEAGAALGISRKFSVPLLEHLDRLHLTRREGDRRTMSVSANLDAE